MVSIDTRMIYPYIDVSIKVDDTTIELGLMDKNQIKELYNSLKSEVEYLSRYIED